MLGTGQGAREGTVRSWILLCKSWRPFSRWSISPVICSQQWRCSVNCSWCWETGMKLIEFEGRPERRCWTVLSISLFTLGENCGEAVFWTLILLEWAERISEAGSRQLPGKLKFRWRIGTCSSLWLSASLYIFSAPNLEILAWPILTWLRPKHLAFFYETRIY